ncbi:hypothetical protein KPSA1_03010 [Pseudomonas syringae pv. actinidiae]|uniref:Uncharacterized protein n=1 Tax=Pseudomonas syringae pv. actinidiae TaxID=103796 RepID=A0A2V0QLW4_PSESF|nr:hypothetical protein KPSA1_03010 [Pseudomonas syringae pv. actinidiae]
MQARRATLADLTLLFRPAGPIHENRADGMRRLATRFISRAMLAEATQTHQKVPLQQ